MLKNRLGYRDRHFLLTEAVIKTASQNTLTEAVFLFTEALLYNRLS